MDNSLLVTSIVLIITLLIMFLMWLIPVLMCRCARKRFEEYLSQFSKESLDYYIAYYWNEFERKSISENEFKYTWNIQEIDSYIILSKVRMTSPQYYSINYTVVIICDKNNKVLKVES